MNKVNSYAGSMTGTGGLKVRLCACLMNDVGMKKNLIWKYPLCIKPPFLKGVKGVWTVAYLM